MGRTSAEGILHDIHQVDRIKLPPGAAQCKQKDLGRGWGNIRILTEMLKQLDERQIDNITAIVEGLLHRDGK